jgi:uncharacterized protein YigE (DUF2233 family)
MIVFDERDFVLKVINNAIGNRPKFPNLESAMKSLQAVAGCNGGFFNCSPFDPVGLVVSNDLGPPLTTGSFEADNWLNGLLVIRKEQAVLVSSSGFIQDKEIRACLQSGPLLLKEGQLESGLGNDGRARRTFIGNNGKGQWVLGACQYVSLQELAKALLSSETGKIIQVQNALNLDGGPSTGLWLKQSSASDFYLRDGWSVRNYIGVFPKDKK